MTFSRPLPLAAIRRAVVPGEPVTSREIDGQILALFFPEPCRVVFVVAFNCGRICELQIESSTRHRLRLDQIAG